jgi:hypothetical protein
MRARDIVVDLFGADEGHWPEFPKEITNEEMLIAWLRDLKATIEAGLYEMGIDEQALDQLEWEAQAEAQSHYEPEDIA